MKKKLKYTALSLIGVFCLALVLPSCLVIISDTTRDVKFNKKNKSEAAAKHTTAPNSSYTTTE